MRITLLEKSLINKGILIILIMIVASCSGENRQKDLQFISKIKEHLDKKGDIVRVSDIHPGDWIKVCFTYGGMSTGNIIDDISRITRIDKRDFEIINRSKADVSYVDDFDWGVYFFHAQNKIEYYSIRNSHLIRGVALNSDDLNCLKKEDAFFEGYLRTENSDVVTLNLGNRERLSK